jgi:hypothetical protein
VERDHEKLKVIRDKIEDSQETIEAIEKKDGEQSRNKSRPGRNESQNEGQPRKGGDGNKRHSFRTGSDLRNSVEDVS